MKIFLLSILIALSGCGGTKAYLYMNPDGVDCYVKNANNVIMFEKPKIVYISNRPIDATIENNGFKSSIRSSTESNNYMETIKEIIPWMLLKET
jgi:hypothetical protein